MIVFSSFMNIGLFINSEMGRKTAKVVVAYCKMLDCPFLPKYPYIMGCCSREELLVSHRVPPQMADRGRLTRYGGYWGNKNTQGGPKPAPLPCGEGEPSKARGRNPDRKSACSEA
jgi:hypothetical protein